MSTSVTNHCLTACSDWLHNHRTTLEFARVETNGVRLRVSSSAILSVQRQTLLLSTLPWLTYPNVFKCHERYFRLCSSGTGTGTVQVGIRVCVCVWERQRAQWQMLSVTGIMSVYSLEAPKCILCVCVCIYIYIYIYIYGKLLHEQRETSPSDHCVSVCECVRGKGQHCHSYTGVNMGFHLQGWGGWKLIKNRAWGDTMVPVLVCVSISRHTPPPPPSEGGGGLGSFEEG